VSAEGDAMARRARYAGRSLIAFNVGARSWEHASSRNRTRISRKGAKGQRGKRGREGSPREVRGPVIGSLSMDFERGRPELIEVDELGARLRQTWRDYRCADCDRFVVEV